MEHVAVLWHAHERVDFWGGVIEEGLATKSHAPGLLGGGFEPLPPPQLPPAGQLGLVPPPPEVISKVEVPDTEPEVAAMVTVPLATPVATPVEKSIVAIVGSLEVHIHSDDGVMRVPLAS